MHIKGISTAISDIFFSPVAFGVVAFQLLNWSVRADSTLHDDRSQTIVHAFQAGQTWGCVALDK